jgi:uncharacterized protein
MAHDYNDIYVRYWRLAALLAFSCGALCWGGGAFGLTRTEIYQTTVPVADRSEASQSAAFQAAMRVVLIRVTGRRSADEDAALAPLLGNARRYVQQFRGAPDSQLWVAFDGPAIERWLTQNGQPLWGRDRPSTFVWLGVQTGPQAGILVTADDASELKGAIVAAAAARGVPLLWPSAADLDKNHLDYSSVSGTGSVNAGSGSLGELAHRLGADAVLIGRASNATASAGVRWTHQFQDRSSEVAGTVEGVNRAADTYASLFAASGALAPVDIEVSGVADLKDYASVQTYLESLSFISHVSVQALTGDVVKYRLTTRGGVESLQRALALNGRLQSLPVGDNGIQRFQLRR